jgi:hypothetical protein
MKFGAVVLFKKLSEQPEFYENRRSDRHSFLEGVNEFLSVFLYFFANLQKKA